MAENEPGLFSANLFISSSVDIFIMNFNNEAFHSDIFFHIQPFFSKWKPFFERKIFHSIKIDIIFYKVLAKRPS